MLDKSSRYEIVPVFENSKKVLVLYKSTETGHNFVVVAGYYLGKMKDFDESVLTEIETISTADYDRLKKQLRDAIKSKDIERKAPITFW